MMTRCDQSYVLTSFVGEWDGLEDGLDVGYFVGDRVGLLVVGSLETEGSDEG